MSGWWQCIGVNGSGMTVPFFDDDDRIVFRANQRAAIGDPVRIEGRQGLWRYTARAGAYIEVVGMVSVSGSSLSTQLATRERRSRHETWLPVHKSQQ
jgi:hypothetical protein